ncbi:hypothetical protein IU501_10805 [Nocardia otitidiscaviarum]|uniref:hypothetical protein n=1 Tax=Nocardia otitidiscaviarum TaxID=1823 RepID=UPI001893288F|nr:hypothetical protein [Nocardia otitidiscaviarum]MBF6133488.1 hypothetical protein [Nocardia otitidiscaviarum]
MTGLVCTRCRTPFRDDARRYGTARLPVCCGCARRSGAYCGATGPTQSVTGTETAVVCTKLAGHDGGHAGYGHVLRTVEWEDPS